ncbi:VOC family protein [Rhodanobacter sp. C03]|uniref:VOC family protein n=1 Tax=Rhodanobacter sp. C03 TaxID=1945858 RepID=UPI0020C3EDB1|nr:VOC family protein [Rhodanobacter sp. C03]
MSIGVPDLAQATAFFRNILDCEPIGLTAVNTTTSEAGSQHAGVPSSRLLLCDSGNVVELFDNHAANSLSASRHSANRSNEPISFSAGDVAHADRWLRHEGVNVIGSPMTATSGPHAGQTVVNFVAPWGLRLQLVGRNTSQLATAP